MLLISSTVPNCYLLWLLTSLTLNPLIGADIHLIELQDWSISIKDLRYVSLLLFFETLIENEEHCSRLSLHSGWYRKDDRNMSSSQFHMEIMSKHFSVLNFFRVLWIISRSIHPPPPMAVGLFLGRTKYQISCIASTGKNVEFMVLWHYS